jgi:hypothetical protein
MWSESEDRGVDLGELIPSWADFTGLIGALDQSDWCRGFVGFVSDE